MAQNDDEIAGWGLGVCIDTGTVLSTGGGGPQRLQCRMPKIVNKSEEQKVAEAEVESFRANLGAAEGAVARIIGG